MFIVFMNEVESIVTLATASWSGCNWRATISWNGHNQWATASWRELWLAVTDASREQQLNRTEVGWLVRLGLPQSLVLARDAAA